MQNRYFNLLILTATLPALAACEGALYATRSAVDSVNYKLVKFSDEHNPRRNEPTPPVQSAYCYDANSDVICYRDPLPGANERLIGYQEPLIENPISGAQVVAVGPGPSNQVLVAPPGTVAIIDTPPPGLPAGTTRIIESDGPKPLIAQ